MFTPTNNDPIYGMNTRFAGNFYVKQFFQFQSMPSAYTTIYIRSKKVTFLDMDITLNFTKLNEELQNIATPLYEVLPLLENIT